MSSGERASVCAGVSSSASYQSAMCCAAQNWLSLVYALGAWIAPNTREV